MGKKVALVTDSTAYLPREWVDKYNIPIAASIVIWDGEELQDYFDINADQFFKRLAIHQPPFFQNLIYITTS